MADVTSFEIIYNSFLNRITDDMYLEIDEEETRSILQNLLFNTIPLFEYPRFNIYDYVEGQSVTDEDTGTTTWEEGYFNSALSLEEINILAIGMVIEWIKVQTDTIENYREKMTGSDFKLSSQANHISKLKVMADARQKEFKHAQRLYGRRKFVDGEAQSTLGRIMGTPSYGLTYGTDDLNAVRTRY